MGPADPKPPHGMTAVTPQIKALALHVHAHTNFHRNFNGMLKNIMIAVYAVFGGATRCGDTFILANLKIYAGMGLAPLEYTEEIRTHRPTCSAEHPAYQVGS